MQTDDFLRLEYEALRAEILATQRRNHQTLAFGILGVPAVNYLADKFDLPVLRLTLPLMVIVIALMYVADNHSIIRCGAYIREHIEKHVPDIVGWENWLESGRDRGTRSTERYLSIGFYLLFGVYFFGAVLLAWSYAERAYGANAAYATAGLYGGLGVWFVLHLISAIRLSTTDALSAPPRP
jgi:hypothetical protein